MASLRVVIWIAGLAGVVVLGQGVGLVHQHGRIATLQAQLTHARDLAGHTAQVCAIAQQGDTQTIAALRLANSQCVAGREQAATLGRTLADEAARDRREGWARYYTMLREREALYESDAECRHWADGPVCPAVVQRLRDDAPADPAPAH